MNTMHRVIRHTLAATALAATALGAQGASTTLIYCSEGSPEGFDPARYTAGTTFDASSQAIFNRIVQFERGGTRIEPALAERWTISPDGLVYTFNLRKGVKFHTTEWFKPTRELNADDVIFTLDRMINKENAFRKAFPASFEYASDMGLDTNIAKLEKPDALTVRITLKTLDAAFLADLAMDFASIQSAEYADQLLKAGTGNDLNTKPVGTGPFVLKRYDKDAQIRYAAFPAYWAGKPAIDNLIFAITTDSAVRAQKLKAGECHVSAYPKPAEVESMKKDPRIKLLHQPGLNVGYLSLNVTHKPFDNRDVRQAINMAINKQSLMSAVYQGAGTVAVNPIPPTMWSYNKAVKDYEYNPEKAKALLAKAGFPNGFETKLWALPVQRPYNPNGQQTAELIQSDLAKVGIKAQIVKYEWAEYLKRGKAGESDIGMFGWNGDNGDPDNFLAVLLGCAAVGGSNYAQWCDPEFDSLITKAKQTADVAQRTKLYETAQEVVKRQAPWVPLAHSVMYQPMLQNVEGYKLSPFASVQFFGVRLK
ncbi:ABC transporter substrate-binding protein [Rhizobacter sp. Root1221]|uniref:ABC transporter substrate-binding protein n=1 Tax=Rhizobacter sp. Root1221 TaxID=1736433 RepID=UPI000A9CD18A|nr:ABC transporter substrate-binding protein [Rhizobacter sp. Root1221]